jgi:hypothetical protein
MRPARALILVAAQGVAAAVAAGTLQAQVADSVNHLRDRWHFSVAGSVFRLGSTIRIDASDGSQGSEISSDDVGLAKNGFQPRFEVRWRPGRRHEVAATYQLVRSSGERVLTDTLTFRDTVFAAGLRVNSKSQFDVATLTYRFAFRLRERSDIGLALAVGAFNIANTLDAVAGATTGGADTAIVEYSRSGNTVAPSVALGLYGRWRTGARWYIEADARALYVPIDRVTVGVIEAGGVVRYFLSPRFGLEAGYALNAVGLKLDPKADGSGLAGKIRFGVQTLRLGVVAAL